MQISTNVKALSTLVIILLIIVSAIIGGIISYAFTIAYYTKLPEKTSLTINNVYIDKENIRSFTVNVLNPSYSPADANISRIAISLKEGTQLYDVVDSDPSIKGGIVVPVGESINITCFKVKKDSVNFTLGELIGSYDFAGKTLVVHVFSSSLNSAASNIEASLPFVGLTITADFNPNNFGKFNITLANNPASEVNLTVGSIIVPGVDVTGMSPDLEEQSKTIPRNESVCFMFNGSWYGVVKTNIAVYTSQGYIFHKEIALTNVSVIISDVAFDEENTGHFNVSISNSEESAIYVNVTKIECTLGNGTALSPFDCGSAGIMPNSTRTFTFEWNWKMYRGQNLTVVAYFLQNFQTTTFRVVTPQPVIVKILNETGVFDLSNTGHFSVVILNHESSIESINITKIVVKETGKVLNGTEVNPQLPYSALSPGNSETFNCTFDWADFIDVHGRNLTLAVYVQANTSLEEYIFNFSFVLPVAKLGITAIDCSTFAGYLNITIKSSDYSLWNLTVSRVVITVQGLSSPLEYVFPENQMTLKPGDEAVLLCPFNCQQYKDKDIIVTVVTAELVEASETYHVPP